MNIKYFFLLAVFVTILVNSAATETGKPMKENIPQVVAYTGNIVRIGIRNIPKVNLAAYKVLLMSKKKTMITASILRDNDEGEVLFGIRSTMREGQYRIMLQRSQKARLIGILIVKKKDFLLEKIQLTAALQDVLKVDTKKIREAQFLWELTDSFFRENRYQNEGFIYPIKKYKRISSQYGMRRVFTNMEDEKIKSSIHGGIDFSALKGIEVYSPAKGKVVFSKERIVTGKTVVISHYPGLFSLYYHMDKINVKNNQEVDVGDIIGTVGDTGLATATHLHWEMRLNNIQVNPKQFTSRIKKTILEWQTP